MGGGRAGDRGGLCFGACGAQIGTGFLSCPEAGTDAPRRALLAKASDTDTMVIDAFSGRSARAMRSRFAEAMEKSCEPLPAFRQMYALSKPLLDVGPDSEASFHLCGQAASLNRALPAAELFRLFIDDAAEVFGKLSMRGR